MTTSSPAALAFAAALTLFVLPGCGEKVPEPTPEPRRATTAEPSTGEPSEMIQEDVTIGTGAEAKTGDKVKVNYTGHLLATNFTFDSSVGKQPFAFELGKGAVIKGWDQGVVGMKVGGKRKLTIPSRLAYGDAGSPPKIPGKATLVFDIELLSVGDDAKDAGADADGGKGDKSNKGDKKPAPKK